MDAVLTVTDLKKLHDQMVTDAEALRERAEYEERAAQAIEETLAILKRGAPTRIPAPKNRFKGLTQKQVMVKLAEEGNGIIRLKDAKRVFLEAKLSKSTTHLTPHLYKLMRQTKLFEKVSTGVYRLKSAQEAKAS